MCRSVTYVRLSMSFYVCACARDGMTSSGRSTFTPCQNVETEFMTHAATELNNNPTFPLRCMLQFRARGPKISANLWHVRVMRNMHNRWYMEMERHSGPVDVPDRHTCIVAWHHTLPDRLSVDVLHRETEYSCADRRAYLSSWSSNLAELVYCL